MAKRILFIQPSYFPANQSSGPNLSLHLLARGFVAAGWEVSVYTTDYDVNVAVDIPHDVDGVKVAYFRVLSRKYWGQISLKMYHQLNKHLMTFDYIYITPIWNPFLWYPLHLAMKRGAALIISPRGGLSRYAVEKKNTIFKRMAFGFLRGAITRATAIHYTTQSEQEDAEKYWGIDVPSMVIPNGVDLTIFRELPAKGSFRKKYGFPKRFLLSLGRIGWIKGLDITALAFSRLLKDFPDLKWVIAGRDDGYKKKLLDQLEQLDCRDKVEFIGLLQGNDKLSALVDADVFVFSSYSESFGMAAVEAMACGAPVVVSNKVGIYKDILNAQAGVVIEPTADELYRGIKMMLSDEQLRLTTARNGKQLAFDFYDIRKVTEGMIRALNRNLSV